MAFFRSLWGSPPSPEEPEPPPLSLFGRNIPRELHEVEAECQVCFEVRPVPSICDCFAAKGCCAACLRHYFTTAVQDALYAMPIIRCPLCRSRVPTAIWASFVDDKVYQKYVGNAEALLAMRCPNCDNSSSLASPVDAPAGSSGALGEARKRASSLRSQLQREELWCDLLTARQAEPQATTDARALVAAWRRFWAAEGTAEDFVARLHMAWPPGKGARPSRVLRRAARRRLPLCIEDPERRMAAQLAWLRMYPKVRTPCCSAAVCFKCKVRGWHPQLTCEERQRQETGRDAQHCPNCQVPTTRSDGCTQIRCVCGTEWTWQDREAPPGHEEDLEDDSDGSSEATLPNEVLRSKNGLELACMNPGLRNSKVLDILIFATSEKLKRIPRRPSGPVARRCPRSHDLLPWTTGAFSCDGCQEALTGERHRCEACDYDLCLSCYLQPEAMGSEEAPRRRRRLGVRGHGLRPRRRRQGEEPEDSGVTQEMENKVEVSARRPDPSSSSSSRPELLEVLEDMAGALDSFRQERTSQCPGKPPSVPLPMHFAVRSGNRHVLASLLRFSPPSEAALTELVRLPDSERRGLEELLATQIEATKGLPLFARIHFGLKLESSLGFQQVLGTLPFMALRRQEPVQREHYAQILRQVLGDEWFEAADREALTEELREELLMAEQRRRPLDESLVHRLLRAGADIFQTVHRKCRDGESVEEEEKAESEVSVSSDSPWCPRPESASCAELLAMRGDLNEELLLESIFAGPLEPACRQRLLMIAIWSGNTLLAKRLLSNSGNRLDPAIWRAFRYMKEETRPEMEDAVRHYVAERSLQHVEVPFWALIQMGRKSMPPVSTAEDSKHMQKVSATAGLMHREACSKLNAALAAEDAAFPLDALAAIHKCSDAATRAVFQEQISAKSERPSAGSILKRSKRAATRELLWELRRALCERRLPDMALSKRLLEGATMRTREASEDSDDEEPRPGGPRYATDFDDAPRSCIDLLALNRFGDPEKLRLAIQKATEYGAELNHAGYERPLTLAVRARNVPAVDALLAAGAQVDKQTLAALRQISEVPVRQLIEAKFQEAVNRGECSPLLKNLKDVSLWILVQSGNVKAVQKRLKENVEAVDAALLLALRRCRDVNAREEMFTLLVEKHGDRAVCNAESQAATYELVCELKEALLDERDPDEDLIRELVILGANPQARGVDLESYIEMEDESQVSDDSEGSE